MEQPTDLRAAIVVLVRLPKNSRPVGRAMLDVDPLGAMVSPMVACFPHTKT